MKTQLGFFIDSSKCTGCKTCMVACKDKNGSSENVFFRRVYEFAGGNWYENSDNTWSQDVFAYYLSISCNHCETPACVKACPTTAMRKREQDGLVVVDPSVCIGCRYCEWACPYSVPRFDPIKNRMTKCDGCLDRLGQGLKPICVAACPLRAIEFGPIDELRAKYGDRADIAPLPSPSLTHPSLSVKGARDARPSGDRTGAIMNRKEV